MKGRLDDDRKGGQATEIETHSSVEGTVSGKSASGFTVGGVKVSVDDSTKNHDASGASRGEFQNDDRVRVTGVPDDKGGLRASSVRASTSLAAGEAEVRGYVGNVSGNNFSLALTPGGTAFASVVGGAFAAPVAGTFVEVKGTSNGLTPPTITLTRAAQAEDGLKGAAQFEAEVEGIVTAGTLSSFVVNGTTVTTSGSTTYSGIPAGSTAAEEFAVGIKVEAEGTQAADGSIVARKVKFKDAARLRGTVSGATATGFTLLGKSVITDTGVAVPANGTFVEVRGYPRADGTIFAQRVKTSGGNDRPFVQGVVTAKTADTLTILGFSISTAGSSFKDDTGGTEATIDRATFFQKAVVGSLVKADWNAGTTDFSTPARELEIESEDG